MTEHVAGTTMVVICLFAAAICGVSRAMVILFLAERRDVMTMLRLPSGRLPSKGRREHGRQQDGKQSRGDESGGATHVRILSHKYQWPRAL